MVTTFKLVIANGDLAQESHFLSGLPQRLTTIKQVAVMAAGLATGNIDDGVGLHANSLSVLPLGKRDFDGFLLVQTITFVDRDQSVEILI